MVQEEVGGTVNTQIQNGLLCLCVQTAAVNITTTTIAVDVSMTYNS